VWGCGFCFDRNLSEGQGTQPLKKKLPCDVGIVFMGSRKHYYLRIRNRKEQGVSPPEKTMWGRQPDGGYALSQRLSPESVNK